MARRPDDDGPKRSRSARAAWVVLIGLGVVVLGRASVATIVQVHGHGMSPSILDDESVVMMRGTWGIDPGDIVVYDPSPPERREAEPVQPPPARRSSHGPEAGGRAIDEEVEPRGELRNTAVVESEDVEANWARVADADRPRGYRVGRVIALPGDEVTFHVPEVPLGLLVNGEAIGHKRGEIGSAGANVWETVGDARYPIIASDQPTVWPGVGVGELTLQVRAEGYLVLADNRDEGACCDSRMLGFIPAEKIRGEVVVRLAGEGHERPMSALP